MYKVVYCLFSNSIYKPFYFHNLIYFFKETEFNEKFT